MIKERDVVTCIYDMNIGFCYELVITINAAGLCTSWDPEDEYGVTSEIPLNVLEKEYAYFTIEQWPRLGVFVL